MEPQKYFATISLHFDITKVYSQYIPEELCIMSVQ